MIVLISSFEVGDFDAELPAQVRLAGSLDDVSSEAEHLILIIVTMTI
jgi:hypothetical protein